MANSRLRLYSSGDTAAPILSGSITGSLLNMLGKVLVDGYGTTGAAGWTRPIADSGSCGTFKQGTGSMMTLYVRDNAGGSGGTKEARITGFESVSNIALTFPTGSNSFPSASQAGLSQPVSPGGPNQSGYLLARVSTTTDTTVRPWLVFADSSSMYCFIFTGDNAANQLAFSFGDFYSIKSGSNDDYRCLITGRITENSATITVDKTDVLSAVTAVVTGNFSPRSYTGIAGTSVAMGKHGDGVKGSTTALLGSVVFPNSADSAVYISPVWVTESTTGLVRGRMRGFYHFLHAIANVTNGQVFSGSGDFAGKTLQVVKASGNSGVYLMETSATVETND
jgi:hypothetical protein